MPKHSKRNNKGFTALPVTGSVALSTLGDGILIKAPVITGLFTEDFFVISADIQVMVRNLTSGEGEPSSWGLAHSDYTNTEIQEHLDVALLGRGSKQEMERQRRVVRKGGQLVHLTAEDELIPLDKSHRVKCKFMIQEGFMLNIYLRNRSGAALTTGAIFEWNGVVYGRFIT